MLSKFNITSVVHYTPLHYLPFICRSSSLMSKKILRDHGYGESHYRTMSKDRDDERGFVEYVHLTVDLEPKILQAKLRAGFPHVGLLVPSEYVENTDYHLCRYNVAMTRQLRRDGKPGFPEGPKTGRYYGNKQIPIAQNNQDKRSLIETNLGKNMIEVLVPQELPLGNEVTIVAYCEADKIIVEQVLLATKSPWVVQVRDSATPYDRKIDYVNSVEHFIKQSLENTDWKGNGLEYDRF